jgi:uncharacterized protein
MANPFSFGSPVSGDRFDDRQTEVRFLVRRMSSGQNVVLTSPRRYGKTSLLLRAVSEARKKEHARVGIASLLRCSSRREVAEEVTRAVIDGALGWMVGTAEQVSERLRRLPRVTPTLAHEGWRFALAIGGGPEDFLLDIRRPIELLADSRLDRHPVCLVLDEFQQIAEIDQHLAGFFKSVIDDLPGVSLVFSGSRRHMMERLFVGSGAALKNAAEPLSLEVIPEAVMTQFLVARMKSAGRTLTPAGARLSYRLMRGIPHFVQLLASAVYDQDVEVADEDAVRAALVEVLTRQRADLAARYESLPMNQRKLVRGLARSPVRDLLSRESLRQLEMSPASAQRARDALRQAEQIEFDGQVGWRVSDPVFERWLRYGLELDLGAAIAPSSIQIE